MKIIKLVFILVITSVLLNSCATIFFGTKQKVTVTSTPEGADIYLNNENIGQKTPAVIKVKKKVKTPEKNTQLYSFKKDGYQSNTVKDKATTNGGAVAVSLLGAFAGFVGIIVDAVDGSYNKYSKTIHTTLIQGNLTPTTEIAENNPTHEKNTDNLDGLSINELEELKTKAVENEDYNQANAIKIKIEQLKETQQQNTTETNTTETNTTKTNPANNIIPSATKIDPSSFEVILDEDFSDNSYGWGEKTAKKATYQITDGKYYMKDNTITLRGPKHLIKGFNCKDDNYILEASFSFLDEKDYQVVGLGFGFSPDSSLRYDFNIIIEENKPKAVIIPFLGVGLKTIKQDPIFSGPVNLNKKDNTIKIVKSDTSTIFYVNDSKIANTPNLVFNSSLIKFNTGIWNKTAVNSIKITKTGKSKIIVDEINKRDIAYKKILSQGITYTNSKTAEVLSNNNSNEKTKIKNATENSVAKSIKYRRSSLHTMMIDDPTIKFHTTIKNAFGNSILPKKFNNHNVGPYTIVSFNNIKKQNEQITRFLVKNDIAKKIVEKWFNRNKDGNYNMDLIAERGLYDASAIDQAIASNTERGNTLLADAGEELINKTFVIVNDFKFIDKEKSAGIVSKAFEDVASDYAREGNIGGSAMAGALGLGVKIAGKGYVIKSTSYLYQLVWNEETAAIFYQDYWTDVNNPNPNKVTAFNNSNQFKLKYIGSQSALADVQSSIFTDKSDEELIEMATKKAIDKAIAKLERKFEAFRTKVPLHSAEPLGAKIGSKEGLEKGDKFEVLEQYIDKEGKTAYKRIGIIKVDEVWNNDYSAEEMQQLKKEGKLTGNQFTTFKGSGNYYPGLLIKQIN